MGVCKYCGRSGFFLTVNQDGLCTSCAPIIVMDAKNKLRIINDSAKLVEESKNLKTKLSRCDLLIRIAESLLDYENKGIRVINPAPSVFVENYKKNRNEIILEFIKQAIEKTKAKIDIEASTKTKINEINKVLLLIQDNKTELTDHSEIEKLEKEAQEEKHKIQLNSFMEEAKKAEFKGQKKKALDQYQEALYFLRNDKINDDLQEDYIKRINEKISELSN